MAKELKHILDGNIYQYADSIEIGEKICEAVSVNPNIVTSLTLVVQANESMVTLTINMIAPKISDIAWGELLELDDNEQ